MISQGPIMRTLLAVLIGVRILAAQQNQAPAQPPAVAARPAEVRQAPPGPVVEPKRSAPAVVSFGLMVGGNLRGVLTSTSSSAGTVEDTSGHLLIGPTLQIHWSRVTLEIDALYRGYNTRASGNLLGLSFENRSDGRAWEFPVLIKRRFYPEAKVRPILGAGVAVRYIGQRSVLSTPFIPNTTQSSAQTNYVFGVPLAAGIEFRGNRFRFTPEFRYIFWAPDNSAFPVGSQGGIFQSNKNQFQLLASFTF